MKKELIFLEPVLKETIWGGSRIKNDFNIKNASDCTGESWCISAHPNGDSVIKLGKYKGKRLSELWKENKELFGNVETKEFPLLIKIIDAKEDLSIQVHPDDEYAYKNENGSLGKKECWYVLDCNEDSNIVIGHNAKTKEELEYMIKNGMWEKFIREIPIKKGDFFQINPGTLHAIKAGTLIFEIQQSCDITYRVYDYDRLCNGKLRQLHLEKSIDVINVPFKMEKSELQQGEVLIKCDKYTVMKLEVESERVIKNKDKFQCVTIIEGEGYANDELVRKGDSFIICSNSGDVKIKGKLELIMSYV